MGTFKGRYHNGNASKGQPNGSNNTFAKPSQSPTKKQNRTKKQYYYHHLHQPKKCPTTTAYRDDLSSKQPFPAMAGANNHPIAARVPSNAIPSSNVKNNTHNIRCSSGSGTTTSSNPTPSNRHLRFGEGPPPDNNKSKMEPVTSRGSKTQTPQNKHIRFDSPKMEESSSSETMQSHIKDPHPHQNQEQKQKQQQSFRSTDCPGPNRPPPVNVTSWQRNPPTATTPTPNSSTSHLPVRFGAPPPPRQNNPATTNNNNNWFNNTQPAGGHSRPTNGHHQHQQLPLHHSGAPNHHAAAIRWNRNHTNNRHLNHNSFGRPDNMEPRGGVVERPYPNSNHYNDNSTGRIMRSNQYPGHPHQRSGPPPGMGNNTHRFGPLNNHMEMRATVMQQPAVPPPIHGNTNQITNKVPAASEDTPATTTPSITSPTAEDKANAKRIKKELEKKRSKLDSSNKKHLEAKIKENEMESSVSRLTSQCSDLEEQIRQQQEQLRQKQEQLQEKRKELESAKTAKEDATEKCKARESKQQKRQAEYDYLVECLQGVKTKFKRLPFFKDPGKVGDTREWDGITYFYCPFNHNNGHWVAHKPDDCVQLQISAKKRASNASTPDNSPKRVKKNRANSVGSATSHQSSNNSPPPFAEEPGKQGDTRTWGGQTYYYCHYNHNRTHWHAHKPEHCMLARIKPKGGEEDPAIKSISGKDSANVVVALSSASQSPTRVLRSQDKQGQHNSGSTDNHSTKKTETTEKKNGVDTATPAMTRSQLIQMAQDSDRDGNVKAKLIEFVTKSSLATLHQAFQLPSMVHAQSLSIYDSVGIMRVIVKGCFHLRPRFVKRIAEDDDLKAWLVSQRGGGVLLTGKHLREVQKRIIALLELTD